MKTMKCSIVTMCILTILALLAGCGGAEITFTDNSGFEGGDEDTEQTGESENPDVEQTEVADFPDGDIEQSEEESDGEETDGEEIEEEPEDPWCHILPYPCSKLQGTCPDNQVCLASSEDRHYCMGWRNVELRFGGPPENPSKEEYSIPPSDKYIGWKDGVWVEFCEPDHRQECDAFGLDEYNPCCARKIGIWYPEGPVPKPVPYPPYPPFTYTCDADHNATPHPKEGVCLVLLNEFSIVHHVVEDQEIDSDNPCAYCDVSVSQLELVNLEEGTECGEGMVCDAEGICVEIGK